MAKDKDGKDKKRADTSAGTADPDSSGKDPKYTMTAGEPKRFSLGWFKWLALVMLKIGLTLTLVFCVVAAVAFGAFYWGGHNKTVQMTAQVEAKDKTITAHVATLNQIMEARQPTLDYWGNIARFNLAYDQLVKAGWEDMAHRMPSDLPEGRYTHPAWTRSELVKLTKDDGTGLFTAKFVDTSEPEKSLSTTLPNILTALANADNFGATSYNTGELGPLPIMICDSSVADNNCGDGVDVSQVLIGLAEDKQALSGLGWILNQVPVEVFTILGADEDEVKREIAEHWKVLSTTDFATMAKNPDVQPTSDVQRFYLNRYRSNEDPEHMDRIYKYEIAMAAVKYNVDTDGSMVTQVTKEMSDAIEHDYGWHIVQLEPDEEDAKADE